MGALIPNDSTRFPPLKKIVLRQSGLASTLPVPARTPRAFPEARKPPAFPLTIRDEMLELYAFKFCQGGFHGLGMTFEQFLLVAAVIKPYGIVDAHRDSECVRAAATEDLR